MSAWLGGLDAVLTAVAAGATVTAVVIAKRTLGVAREAAHLNRESVGLGSETAHLNRAASWMLDHALREARAARTVEQVSAALGALNRLWVPLRDVDPEEAKVAPYGWAAALTYERDRPDFLATLTVAVPDRDAVEFAACWRIATAWARASGADLAQASDELRRLLSTRRQTLAVVEAERPPGGGQ